MTPQWTPRRVFGTYLVGILLVQAAWILTVPAFRGSDEFDHVYKAAAVARGQWTAPEAAPHGRGGVVTIPESIVRAASPVCRYYKYVGHDNCFPIRTVGHGQAEVATAAGAYNPAYYLVVGTLARPFSGAGADFAMRAVTALLCALLLAWSAAIITRWATTAWPLLAFTVGLTPVLMYSTAITAPNGVTYASAALVWAALMGLARSENGGRGLALPLTLGAAALLATHTSGVMWLGFTVVIAAVLRPVRDWIGVLGKRWRTWLLAGAIVVIVAVMCVAWIRLEHTNNLGTAVLEKDPFPFAELPMYQMLWALQAIAAFPMRNEPAPLPVYALWGVVLVAVLVALFRKGTLRERLAGTVALGLLVVVPTILTVIAFRTEGAAWQGRYSLPLWLGITSLAGLALDRARTGPSPQLVSVVLALLATAMAISTVHVGLFEIAHRPRDPVVAGMPGGMVLVGVLAAVGVLTPLLVLGRQRAIALPPSDEVSQPTSIGTHAP